VSVREGESERASERERERARPLLFADIIQERERARGGGEAGEVGGGRERKTTPLCRHHTKHTQRDKQKERQINRKEGGGGERQKETERERERDHSSSPSSYKTQWRSPCSDLSYCVIVPENRSPSPKILKKSAPYDFI
jgi:hypothetical protein